MGENLRKSLALAYFTNKSFAVLGNTVFTNNIFAHSNRSTKFAKLFPHEINPLYSYLPLVSICSKLTHTITPSILVC